MPERWRGPEHPATGFKFTSTLDANGVGSYHVHTGIGIGVDARIGGGQGPRTVPVSLDLHIHGDWATRGVRVRKDRTGSRQGGQRIARGIQQGEVEVAAGERSGKRPARAHGNDEIVNIRKAGYGARQVAVPRRQGVCRGEGAIGFHLRELEGGVC